MSKIEIMKKNKKKRVKRYNKAVAYINNGGISFISALLYRDELTEALRLAAGLKKTKP
jgi:hypothetical protein